MSKAAVIHARIEQSKKTAAEKILHKLGISPTEAIRMFYTQITLRKGLPFQVHIPNDLTKKTLVKSRSGKEVDHFDSLDDMFSSWDK